MAVSSEQKLPFDLVLPLLLEAEEATWRHGNTTLGMGTRTDTSEETDNTLPMTLLRHGTSIMNNQNYFSRLESRKCCLNLAAGQTTFSNIRLVHGDERDLAVDDDVVLGHRCGAPLVDQLSDREYECYSRALLCAELPVLCVPDPPSVVSPNSPASPPLRFTPPTFTTRDWTLSDVTIPDCSATSDSEDLSVSIIPSETLCDLLRPAFGLSHQRASQYDRIIHAPYRKKTPAKILVEELMNQLSLLENNKHPFYHPRTFLSRNAYEHWRQRHRRHLGDLINKFWHSSLPSLKHSARYDPSRYHDNYKLLLNKLIRYESSLKDDESGHMTSAGPLSTAALRLLKEFGLRYSIGQLYRRLAYLSYLATHFENELCYIQLVTSVLRGMRATFPPSRNRVVMVHAEYDLLYEASVILHGQCENSLTRIKRLFPGQRPEEGVGSLIDLLTSILDLKAYLLNRPEKPVSHFLNKYAKANFVMDYENQKMIVVSDLKLAAPDKLTPKLVNRLLTYARDEVTDYVNNFHSVFQKYFDVGRLAAQSFYSCLMGDVHGLCGTDRLTQTNGLDLQMLSLAYRLHQLDLDWRNHIPLEYQSWRRIYRSQAGHWMDVLKAHSEQLTVQTFGLDKFVTLQVEERGVQVPPSSRPSSGSKSSHTSLQQSLTSAFSQVKVKEKPTAQGKEQILSGWMTDSMQLEDSGSFPPDGAANPSQSWSHQGQAGSEETSFIGARGGNMTPPGGETASELTGSVGGVRVVLCPPSDDLQRPAAEVTPGEDSQQHQRDDQKGLRGPQKSESVSPSLDHPRSFDLSPPNLHRKPDESCAIEQSRSRRESVKASCDMTASDIDDPAAVSSVSPASQTQSHITDEEESKHSRGTLSTDAAQQTRSVDFLYPIEEVCTDFDVAMATERLETIEETDRTVRPDPQDLSSLSREEHESKTRTAPAGHPVMDPDSCKFRALEKPATSGCDNHAGDGDGKPEMVSEGSPKDSPSRGDSATTFPCSVGSCGGATPALFSGTLPLSGSLMDVTCLVQRITAFTRTLSHTICPITAAGTDGAMGRWIADRDTGGQAQPSEADMRRNLLETRQYLYEKLIQVLSAVICLYADNLVTYDLCGTRDQVARKLVGHQLVDHLKVQYGADKVWGCRHMTRGSGHSCGCYDNRRVTFLADKHEPITEEMCIRINNLHSLCDVIPQVQSEAQQALDLRGLVTAWQGLEPAMEDELVGDFYVVEVCPRAETAGQRSRSRSRPRTGNLQDEAEVVFGHCRCHVTEVKRSLVNLLAYRVNLFFKEALSLLLELGLPLVGIDGRLRPLTAFLDSHLGALSQWLYGDVYNDVVLRLWTFIAQDFEAETLKLTSIPQESKVPAEVLLQTVAFFISYFSKDSVGVSLSDLTPKVGRSTYWLQLQTRPTPYLISLYRQLFVDAVDGSGASSEAPLDLPPRSYVQRMKADLHAIRKCFSGQMMIDWLLSNQPTSTMTDDGYDSDGVSDDHQGDVTRAVDLAQKLLDRGLICAVDDDDDDDAPGATSGGVTPDPSDQSAASPYPGLSVYSYSRQQTPQLSSSVGANCHQGAAPAHMGLVKSWLIGRDASDHDALTRDSDDGNGMTSCQSGNQPDASDSPSYLKFAELTTVNKTRLSQSLPSDMCFPDTERRKPHGTHADDGLLVGTSQKTQRPLDTSSSSPTTSASSSSDVSGTFRHSHRKFYRFTCLGDDLNPPSNDWSGYCDVSLPGYNVPATRHGNMAVEAVRDYNVTPEYVLRILARRKGVDKEASMFLKQLPLDENPHSGGIIIWGGGCCGCSS